MFSFKAHVALLMLYGFFFESSMFIHIDEKPLDLCWLF